MQAIASRICSRNISYHRIKDNTFGIFQSLENFKSFNDALGKRLDKILKIAQIAGLASVVYFAFDVKKFVENHRKDLG